MDAFFRSSSGQRPRRQATRYSRNDACGERVKTHHSVTLALGDTVTDFASATPLARARSGNGLGLNQNLGQGSRWPQVGGKTTH